MSSGVYAEVTNFQIETTSALAEVRSAFSALAKAIQPNIQRASDLHRELKLDYKLSWQVCNVINEADAMTAAKHVPGAPSLQRLLRAAKNRGVSTDITNQVKRAVSRFEQLIVRHAEDRTEFDQMASAIASPSTAAAAELVYRKASFRSDSHIWGVCTEAFCATDIVRLNSDMTTDEVSVTTRRGFRRLRPDASLNVFSSRYYGATGAPPGNERVPLDPKAAEQYGAYILPRFCSQPIPPFRMWKRPDGRQSVDVLSHEIGRQHAVDLAIGQVVRGCPLAKGLQGEPRFQMGVRMITPARLIVAYMLLHRPSFGLVKPELMIFRQTAGDEDIAVALSSLQLPVREEIQYLGNGKAAWQIPDLVNHDELVQTAFNEVGWNPAEFDVFRVRIEYPVLHSVVQMGFSVQ